jgi:aminoglycoside phosphotransferase (APT) family kinase protein
LPGAYDLPPVALDAPFAVPVEVISRLGAAPREVGRFGSARVLLGNGLVLKAGPTDRAAREAFVLEALSGLPVRVPVLVDAGRGWLLLEAVEVVDSDVASWRDAALADLARLHEAFVEEPLLGDARLRGVTRSELALLRERSATLARELDLPEPLRVLAANPEPLVAEIGDATTLVHGDAWPGNVLPTLDGGRCWIDWEEAGVGHPALDLATWLHGSPWVPAAPDPDHDLAVYLAARTSELDEPHFRHVIDAAVVVLFLLLDLPGLTTWDERARREIVERRATTAERFSL